MGWSTGKKKFEPPIKGGTNKILHTRFMLMSKQCLVCPALTVTCRVTWLGLKWYYGEKQKLCNIAGPPDPLTDSQAPEIFTGFLLPPPQIVSIVFVRQNNICCRTVSWTSHHTALCNLLLFPSSDRRLQVTCHAGTQKGQWYSSTHS